MPEEEKRRITLVEILIGVIIIFLLSIIVPGFFNLQARIKRATTKGHLGVLRRSLEYYYHKNDSTYPETLDELVPEYIGKIPKVNIGSFFRYRHTREITNHFSDSGKWYYNSTTGEICIDASYEDENGISIDCW